MNRIKSIMFVGTGSDVGKSVINAGFGRIFKQDGYSPAPFKAQNMALNSFPTKDGLEIGRAQAVQAEACGIDCTVEMNPVLLKPTGNMSSQVILHGKSVGNRSAREYFVGEDRKKLFKDAMSSYYKLDKKFNPVVVEGAGSISEVNLWDKDITNMRVAVDGDIPTYLVADIDKGGVIGSVYGSILLLPEEQRRLIKGIIINKFRGDITLFEEGKRIIKDLTGVPVVGVIPYYKDIFIEQEDSVVVDRLQHASIKNKINIAIPLLKHMSNFTDFDLLSQVDDVNLFYTMDQNELIAADIVIIPGSKNTISDMQHLKDSGMAIALTRRFNAQKPIYGICGGYQMMGEKIFDPEGVEGETEEIDALGFLPTTTTLQGSKKTEQCKFTFNGDISGKGYEIHMGTTDSESPSPLNILSTGEADGYKLNDKVWGTYIHGIFDNREIVESILKVVSSKDLEIESYQEIKDKNFDKLAALIRESVDMDYIYETLKIDA